MVLEDAVSRRCVAPACTSAKRRSLRSVTRAVLLLIGLPLWSATATASSAAEKAEDSTKVGRKVLTLREESGVCVLTDSQTAGRITLELDAPCRFARRGSRSNVQRHAYPKAGSVLYIFGKPEAVETFAARAQVREADLCSSQAQAVVVRPGRTVQARASQKGGLYCPYLGLDEKDFRAAAFPSR